MSGEVSDVQLRVAWIRALYSLGIKPTQKLNYVISAEVHSSTALLQAPWKGSKKLFAVLYIPENIGVFLKAGRVLVLLSKSEWGSWTRSSGPS